VRESGACRRSVERLLSEQNRDEVRALITAGDATRSTRWMREQLFGVLP